MTDDLHARTPLQRWVGELEAALGLAPGTVPADAVLDLTRIVAHGVARPAGPLTAYAAGYAAGRDAASQPGVSTPGATSALDTARELALAWTDDSAPSGGAGSPGGAAGLEP